MNPGSLSARPWRDTAPLPTAPTAPWRTAPPRRPYRMRWWKLAGLAIAGLATLAAVTWGVFWLRPPEPAQLAVLVATYDNTLAVPPNPYGKAAARDLTELTAPGSWYGSRSRLNGPTSPGKLSRTGLGELLPVRGKCVVVVLAAHGGRDRGGAFLFPEDATSEPAARVRIATIIEQFSTLPEKQQKLLILDATEPPAYADLGLVHNDFAAAVEDLNDAIAKVPNLAVFMSTGPDQRSWTSPEWGRSSFLHHVLVGLKGDADADHDNRITGHELVEFVRPRVHDWARDNRGSLQTPVLLPKGDEGESRVRAMHLAMTTDTRHSEPAPTPFGPPPELEQQWKDYRELATAYVPPTAYTPHLWRQFEAWTLRHEQHIIAGDTEGARNARAKAADIKRQIEAARRLPIPPQTLTLQSAVGGLPWVAEVPVECKVALDKFAAATPAERAGVWANSRSLPKYDAETQRLLWCRALVEWTADNPVTKLPFVPALVPLVTEGMPVRPAEINFVLMLALHLPPAEKTSESGEMLKNVLKTRLQAERVAGGVASGRLYPFAEFKVENHDEIRRIVEPDATRRVIEDVAFAGTPEARRQATTGPRKPGTYEEAAERETLGKSQEDQDIIDAPGIFRMPGLAEWVCRDSVTGPKVDRVKRDERFRVLLHRYDEPRLFREELDSIEGDFIRRAAELLNSRPEFEGKPTPRPVAVAWWHDVDAVLTAPLSGTQTPATRRDLVREFRRVSRQLLVLNRTAPEALPEVTPAKAREIAFEMANRRGQLVIAPFGHFDLALPVFALNPGERFQELVSRLDRFPFLANGRQSLAEVSSQLGRLLDAVATFGIKRDGLGEADYWIRLAPAHAAVTDAPIDQLRRNRVRDYLVAQAKRTYLDHWYGEGGTRYYRTAIEQLAASARSLELPKTDDLFKPYLGEELPFPVEAVAPPRFAVTDEPNPEFKVTFRSHSAGEINGFPVFWATPAFPAAKPEPVVRTAIPTDQNASTHALTQRIIRPDTPTPAYPVAETGTTTITGFFRGRVDTRKVAVDVYRRPDRVAASAPGLNLTAVAVRADPRVRGKFGVGTGAVAIVLDCSGSLGPPDPKDPKDRGLYPKALKALGELLAELPPGTTITVSVFGQKAPGVTVAEQTIREVQEPIALTFANREKILTDVNTAVGNLEPWNPSPIVRSVIRAKDRIKNLAVPFKAVVLISDGVDNRFAEDPANADPKRSIGDALRAEFPAAGVSLSVVALEVPTKAELAQQSEFKEIENLKPAGLFVPPEKVKELAAWLRKGLNPQVRFSLDVIGATAGGADLTAGTDATDNWYSGRLEPGTYQLRVGGVSDFSRTVRVEKGDRLLIDLTENRGAISASRHWFADTAPGIKSGKPTDAWRLALLQNRSEAGGLRLFTAIEDRPPTTEPLSVSRLGEAWFEVRPTLPQPTPVAVKWHAAPGYPAPAWALDVPGWPVFPGTPAPASPVIDAWWNPEKPFPATATWSLPAGESLLNAPPRAVKIGDTSVSLDSVTVEGVAVDGTATTRKCLVVRLSHAAKEPVWVRPVGEPAAGSEVRVYRTANRVTCVFWGIDPAKVTGFEVVSLNAALKRAEELGHHGRIETAPGPTPTSPRPEPPVDPR